MRRYHAKIIGDRPPFKWSLWYTTGEKDTGKIQCRMKAWVEEENTGSNSGGTTLREKDVYIEGEANTYVEAIDAAQEAAEEAWVAYQHATTETWEEVLAVQIDNSDPRETA